MPRSPEPMPRYQVVAFPPRARIAKAGDVHALRRGCDDRRLELFPVEQVVVFGGGEHLRLAQLVVAVVNAWFLTVAHSARRCR